MLKKRLAEIEQRKAEIRTMVAEATEDKVRELDAEVDGLNAEAEQIRGRMNLEGKLGSAPVPIAGASEAEERGRALMEKRAVTIASGALVKPVEVQNAVNGMLGRNVSSILDMVKITEMQGLPEYQVPYTKSEPIGGKTAEGADAVEGEVAFGYSVIKPLKITIYTEISKEATMLNAGAYYDKVLEAARNALRRRIAELIINGDAPTNATFIGIQAAPAILPATDISLSAIDAGTLRKLTLLYGGNDDIIGEGVLFLNKNDLIAFGDIRGTNEKKAIYEITPDPANTNTGIIKDGGLAVRYCINSNVPSLADAATGKYGMFYGVPVCYEMALFGDYKVEVSTEAQFRKGMLAVRGEVIVGGNVVVQNGFVRVKKSA